jgi:adenylate kinase
MDTQLIFIAGIHGVGKSTFCKNFEKIHPNLECFSASSLIKNYKSNAFTDLKQVPNVDANQDLLISALESQKTTKDLILLDGHFCLFDSNFIPQKIPQEVFLKLKISLIILLTAPVELIIQRMKNRDGKSHSVEQLSELQDLEISAAKNTAETLNIPLHIITHDNISTNLETNISNAIQAIK